MIKRASIDHNDSRYRYQGDNNEETESQTLIEDELMEELLETSTDI